METMADEGAAQPETVADVHINIQCRAHMDNVLSCLEEQRKKNFLCDITVIVEGLQFRAHKALLAASSEYFSIMFADEGDVGQSVYVMEGVLAEIFEMLLQYIYTGNVNASEKCLQQVVASAHVLKVDSLVKAYTDYQEGKNPEKLHLDETITAITDGDLPKRKRGRPKKLTAEEKHYENVNPAEGESAENNHEKSVLVESVLKEEVITEYAAEVTCDLNVRPGEGQAYLKRQSKRKAQRPLKLQDYRLAEENDQHEAGKQNTKEKKQSSSEYQCKDCGKMFKYRHFLAIHRRVHTGTK